MKYWFFVLSLSLLLTSCMPVKEVLVEDGQGVVRGVMVADGEHEIEIETTGFNPRYKVDGGEWKTLEYEVSADMKDGFEMACGNGGHTAGISDDGKFFYFAFGCVEGSQVFVVETDSGMAHEIGPHATNDFSWTEDGLFVVNYDGVYDRFERYESVSSEEPWVLECVEGCQ